MVLPREQLRMPSKADKTQCRLTNAAVQSYTPKARDYLIYDSIVPGLFLRVLPSGIKSFNVAWKRNRKKSLGKFPGTTVDMARTRARAALVETAEQGAPADAGRVSGKPVTFGAFMKEHYGP